MDNMTAKVSCFARAYHYNNNSIRIFTDDIAEKLLGEDYNQIAKSMSDGIDFFCPGFEGTREEGLRLILDRQLSPSVLGRSVFCESKLAYAIANGCKQYGQQVDYMYGEALYKPEMKEEYHILICKMRLGKPVQAVCPHEGGFLAMITYSELFQFCLLLVAVISLVIQIGHKK